MTNIKIFTAYIKEFEIPTNKDIYIPIHAGKKTSNNNLDMIGDDTGDNISHKNKNYCELTAMYWVWKNYDLKNIQYIGLAHYRRLFNINDNIKDYDIIIPKKENVGTLFNVFSIENQYKYRHIPEDFDIMKEILLKKYPDYDKYINIFTKRSKLYFLNKAHFYNMFIMKKEIFHEYCEWIFDILFECEKYIKISQHTFQSRVFGFLGERLFNIFVEKKKKEGFKILEVNLIKK